MKILIVHNKYRFRGGEDSVVENEIAALRLNGHEVRTYLRTNDEAKGLLARLKLPISAIWSFRTYQEINATIQDFKPDVMHVHNTWMAISPSCYWAAKKNGIPVVQTLHNYRLFCPAATFFREGHVCEECGGKFFPWPGVWHRCYRGSFLSTLLVAVTITVHRAIATWRKTIDIYVALTNFCKTKMAVYGLKKNAVSVKPNFIALDPGKPIEKSGKYAVFVGRLSQEKGVRCLFDAMRLLKGIPIKIVGTGPLASEACEKVRGFDKNDIELLGEKNHAEAMALIRGSCFMIVPSVCYECFPMVIAESFACGKAVVASKIGSLENIVEDGKTGRLFEPGNAESLAAAIKWMFENPEDCAEMGRCARDKFEKEYSSSRNMEILKSIYETAIAREADRRRR